MTSGNKQSSTMVTVSTGCGTASVGSLVSRVWSGADDPLKQKENPYTCTHSSLTNPIIRWAFGTEPTYFYKGTVSTCGFGGGVFFAPSQTELDLLRTRVLKGVLGKYKQHDFNAAVFLGELPKTVQMVSEPLLDTLKAFRYVRKGRFDKAVRVFRARDPAFRVDRHASNAWLSLRYGWMPAINDSYAAAEAYHVLQKAKPVKRVRVRSAATLKTKNTSTYCNHRTDTGIAVTLISDYQQSMFESLGVLNPASLAWELLPFSFVLDWAYDVGSWLELVCTLPVRAGTTYVTTQKQTGEVSGPWRNSSDYVFQSFGGYVERYVTIKRSVSAAPGVPPPRLKNPFNGSASRIFDAVALARALT